jgi:hypothetical protein
MIIHTESDLENAFIYCLISFHTFELNLNFWGKMKHNHCCSAVFISVWAPATTIQFSGSKIETEMHHRGAVSIMFTWG